MLDVALKEWAVVCDLLLAGEQTLLLRKGGIAEDDGPGRFRLETPRFALFPAWLHQRPEGIKPRWREQVKVYDAEPSDIEIRGLGVIDHVWQVPSRDALDKLDDLLCWTPEQIDMRWNYKPDRPLYLLAVRTYRLTMPRTIVNNPQYAGCKSWVHLDADDAIDDTGAAPVIPHAMFQAVVDRVVTAFS